MKVLSVSTAERGASLAFFNETGLVCEYSWISAKTHSSKLLVMIEQLLKDQAGAAVSDLDGFVVAKGPGSFTGLRIGISVVQGLAFGAGRPAAGVSSLDGIGYRFSHADIPVCAMMDAKRGEVYTALYSFNRGILSDKGPEMVCKPEIAASQLPSPCLLAGSGARVYQDRITDIKGEQVIFCPPDMEGVSAAALARQALFDPDFFNRPDYSLAPVYLRKSDAEIYFNR